MTTTVVDTEAEVLSDEVLDEPVTAEEVHGYSVAATAAWLRNPENSAALERWGSEIDARTKRFAQRVEQEFAPTFRMMRDIAVDDRERGSFLDGFLRSITGIED